MSYATLLVLWIGVACVGAAVGHVRGRATSGLFLGLVLGVIGVVIVASMDKTPRRLAAESWEMRRAAGLDMFDDDSYRSAADLSRPCPWCAELSKPASTICRLCVRDVQLQLVPVSVNGRQRAYQWG